MKHILSTLILAALTALPVSAGSKKEAEGLVYYLPKTAVRMHVLVEKTTTEPGQLNDYSDLYFKTSAPQVTTTDYRIVGVKFGTAAVRDENQRYVVNIDNKHSVLNIDCDVNGVLRAINTKAPKAKEEPAFTPAPKAQPLNPRDYMSQDILAAGNLPKMAQLVAQEIYDVRDSRNMLSRGEADFMPKDGEQLRIMYAQLNKQEAALMQLFQGTTVTDTTETVLTFVPEKAQKDQVVFRFSRKFGLLTADDFSGEPYRIKVDDLGLDEEELDVVESAKKEDFQLGVILPGKMRMTLSAAGKKIAQYEAWAAQFGEVKMLSGMLFGKKLTSKILLDSATGSVVSLETEPLE